ncbi:MAG: endonuclease, partial [Clostridium sp.]|nr:endonuclease [Clostridium sp.]
NVKGDVARIYLYMYVRWQQPNLYQDVSTSNLPAFDSDDNANNGLAVIESLDTLLKWIEEDPVDTWELSRNDIVEDVQGNRNVFIDYPELAWKLFGKEVPANLQTPSSSGSTVVVTPQPSTSPVPTTTPTVSPTVTPDGNDVYQLVTSLDQIGEGGKFVIVGVNGNYTRAMGNSLSSGKMSAKTVTIKNNQIMNPSSSIVWNLKEQSKTNQYTIYNEAIKKYVNIKSDATNGYSLTDTPSFYFNATSADAVAKNAIYLTTTASGKRNISIYQTDFRAYKASNYKAMYLYKLIK